MKTALAALLLLVSATAHAAPATPAFDRHALYSVGSEAVITERVVRKVRAAGLRQIRKKHQKRKHREPIIAPANYATASVVPLVEKARAFIGQTASQLGLPHSLWCADFIAKIAPEAARRVDNPRWARDYAILPRTTPKIGAIVVLTRGRGGHIGIVTGFDDRGNPRVISGNHNRRVAESVYSKHRVIAYVSI